MHPAPKTLLVFVDGLGLGPEDPAINPIHGGACPCLERLLAEHAVAIDAQMDMPGLPQSATGQASLLCGLNAAAAAGRHVEGFPTPELREVIREHNVFRRLAARGYRCTFANAYYLDDVSEVQLRKRQSVTTVATLQAFGTVRDAQALLQDQAVYQDLTRKSLRRRGYSGPMITPREAGAHLIEIARAHDFTLFEFYQTDLAAHRAAREEIDQVLSHLDEFIETLLPFAEEDTHLIVLTSDHGNVEDLSQPAHTENPVPFVTLGELGSLLRKLVHSLPDVIPALMEFYPAKI